MSQRGQRKWAWDTDNDGWSPIPTRVVSNEEVPGDYVSRLRAAHPEMGPAPGLTQYGWVREG
jgi:hypothetical protein